MDQVAGARSFAVPAASYDAYMGRYSERLAAPFAAAAGVVPGQTAVDVGCGPGALTGHLAALLGPQAVLACDPSPTFVEACASRHPGVTVLTGRAEELPFDSGVADHAMAQLVLHFVSEPDRAVREMARVVRPGGRVSACVWDFEEGMQVLRAFWDAALALDPGAPDEAGTLRFGGPGEIAGLFAAGGLVDVVEHDLVVTSEYASFDELWAGFLGGVGPAGSWCVRLPDDRRELLRTGLHDRLGSPDGAFSLSAVARCAVATAPAP